MFKIVIADYTLHCLSENLPDNYAKIDSKQAQLVDEIGFDRSSMSPSQHTGTCFLAVYSQHDERRPVLVVAQRYWPAVSGVFDPGVIFVPETHVLFFGAGTHILAYKLDIPEKLWEDSADLGFLHWERYGQWIIMSAETEVAVWDTQGGKRWSQYVEPPWMYTFESETMNLQIMGKVFTFPVDTGPLSVLNWLD